VSEFILVTTSIDSQEGAQRIAEALVKARLAACVHVAGPITSTYWWEGKVETATEWTCSIKTRKELYADLEQAIRSVHPYDVPEIIAVPICAGSQSYLDWIVQETHIQ
jgi:periplasmic divalent cation tolerance protein